MKSHEFSRLPYQKKMSIVAPGVEVKVFSAKKLRIDSYKNQ